MSHGLYFDEELEAVFYELSKRDILKLVEFLVFHSLQRDDTKTIRQQKNEMLRACLEHFTGEL